ncbi:hypothetical protein [Fictibacillus sp. NRS-1165]|uniref:hypothetical protein n=1 Tax=Fictibacillus sp. NRS-1165 TaxID=3144463 RepID=UPI003D212F01
MVIALFISYIVIQYVVFGPKQSGIVTGKLENPEFHTASFIYIATGAIALAAGPF